MVNNNDFQGNVNNHTQNELQLFSDYENYFNTSQLSLSQKLQGFSKYVRRQDISRFLAKNELIKLQLNTPGSIVECGSYTGGGTMTFAQLSAIYEPYNHTRKVIVFDTFDGFPSLDKKDTSSYKEYKKGDLFVMSGIENEIQQAIQLFDRNRPIGHIPKIELVKGDATVTMPKYIADNPHTLISLLYLDFDIYEPTKVAIENCIKRMPKGAIIAFDELNAPAFPGETLALLDTLGISSLKLKKTMFDAYISYAVIE